MKKIWDDYPAIIVIALFAIIATISVLRYNICNQFKIDGQITVYNEKIGIKFDLDDYELHFPIQLTTIQRKIEIGNKIPLKIVRDDNRIRENINTKYHIYIKKNKYIFSHRAVSIEANKTRIGQIITLIAIRDKLFFFRSNRIGRINFDLIREEEQAKILGISNLLGTEQYSNKVIEY